MKSAARNETPAILKARLYACAHSSNHAQPFVRINCSGSRKQGREMGEGAVHGAKHT